MEHKSTVTLETPRLILRRFRARDLEEIFKNCWSDFEVWKWTCYKPMNSADDVRKNADMFTPGWLNAYARPNRYSWAIEEKASGAVIGRMFGMNPDDRTGQVELAYEFGRPWWNRGYMTEAVRAVLGFFFKSVGMSRVYAYHAGPNLASGRVLQKCGMTCTGTEPGACTCNFGRFDRVNYALSAEEYRALNRCVQA